MEYNKKQLEEYMGKIEKTPTNLAEIDFTLDNLTDDQLMKGTKALLNDMKLDEEISSLFNIYKEISQNKRTAAQKIATAFSLNMILFSLIDSGTNVPLAISILVAVLGEAILATVLTNEVPAIKDLTALSKTKILSFPTNSAKNNH